MDRKVDSQGGGLMLAYAQDRHVDSKKCSKENDARAQRIASIPAGGDSWTTDVAKDIKALWADDGIRRVYEMRDRKYHLNESAG